MRNSLVFCHNIRVFGIQIKQIRILDLHAPVPAGSTNDLTSVNKCKEATSRNK